MNKEKPKQGTWHRRVKRFGLGAGITLVLLVAAGAIYQAVSERRDLRANPAPGRFVDVGEHRLHLYCIGSGKPTVLLESGLGNDVNFWSLVQPRVAEFTRVCAYDRAGLGWSDPGPMPRSADRVVEELGRLLERSGEAPPYVIVGHSNGGPYARLYAAAHPERTAGLVLVDPNPETAPTCEQLPEATRILYGSLVSLAPVGLPRLLLPVLFPLEKSALPPEKRQVHGALRARTGALRALWSEQKNACPMLEAVRAIDQPTHDWPVVVLSAQKRRSGMQDVTALHREMAQNLGADFIVAEGSGHWIQLERPDVVVAAIRRIVNGARGRRE